MKTFTINKHIKIEAEYYETRYSWGHKAYLFINGHEVVDDKITYYNRTWESYQFQSILKSIINKAAKDKLISKRQAAVAKKLIQNNFAKKAHEETKSMFRNIAMVAAIGDIMTDTKKEANDWKERMIKAGLGDRGLIMPDDWDTLNDNDKQARLDLVIKELNK